MPPAVLFDVCGVLLLPDPVAVQRAVASAGAYIALSDAANVNYLSTHVVDSDPRLGWRGADTEVLRALGISGPPLTAAAVALGRIFTHGPWVATQHAVAVMSELLGRRTAVGIVTNGDGNVSAWLRRAGLGDIFRTSLQRSAVVPIVDSGVVGIEKPDPAIFRIALDRLGMTAEECLYVGDTVTFDVKGARNAGILGVHVDPLQLCQLRDHPHIADVGGVLSFL